MKKKGFTLIELLVVIAIIGLLSSVVLASLQSARLKANDAKVKAQLSSARASAELYYNSTGQYSYGASVVGNELAGSSIGPGCASGMFANSLLTPHTLAANYPTAGAGLGKCTSNGTFYAITARLNAVGSIWCIDSLGTSKATSSVQANSNYVCG